MTRSPSQHCDEFEIVYVLGRHGWSDLYLIVSGKVHAFRLTHVMCEPMEELIGLCRSLIERGDCWIRLHDEPGATLVKASINREQRHLVDLEVLVSQGWEATPEAAEPLISVTVKATLLIDQIIYQLYMVQALCQESSYARDRSRFPHRLFKDLIASWKTAMGRSRSDPAP